MLKFFEITPEDEFEIMKWLVDHYPNHETNCVKIWELVRIIHHYHVEKMRGNKPLRKAKKEFDLVVDLIDGSSFTMNEKSLEHSLY